VSAGSSSDLIVTRQEVRASDTADAAIEKASTLLNIDSERLMAVGIAEKG